MDVITERHFLLELDEGQRQMVLLACAILALERPGWEHGLEEMTKTIDCVNAYGDGKMRTESLGRIE